MITFLNLPVDLLSPILSHLDDRKDWHSCCRVSRAFYAMAIPYLYRALDSRTTRLHPSSTLLRRPHLAQFVDHVTETGAIHRLGMLVRNPNITKEILAALALCTNLRSMTWIDGSHTTDTSLLRFLAVVRKLPLRELTIRTHGDPSKEVWSQLMSIVGLKKLSLCCTEVPSRVLLGWSEVLGSTLTHLELSRCTDAPTALVSVFQRLPLLRYLRLRGAPSNTILPILAHLPNLRSLDTEYHVANSTSFFSEERAHFLHLTEHGTTGIRLPTLPALRHITVRTSFKADRGSQMLWKWICNLVPFPGLETFCLHGFPWHSDAEVPGSFIMDIAAKHRLTLKHFVVSDCYLSLENIQWLSSKFLNLETLECSLASPNVASILEALSNARSLRSLKMRVRWLSIRAKAFTVHDATQMMLREENSRLRSIAINDAVYNGKWVADHKTYGTHLQFQVFAEPARDNWLV